MRLKQLILLMPFIFLIGKTSAQEPVNLTVGDQVPDFIISKIINSKQKTAKISNFDHQLLLIDFWGTGCSGCIQEVPFIEQLQQQFGDKIKIFMLTTESEKKILEFWKNNKILKNTTIPSIVEDENFTKHFKSSFYGLQVWIYNRKVVAITNPEYVSAEHIEQALTGQILNWPVRYDYFKFDSSRPIFKVDSNQLDLNTKPLKYAGITAYLEKVKETGEFSAGQSIFRDKEKKTIRYLILNQAILSSYLLAYNYIMPSTSMQHIVWEVKDRSKYTYYSHFGGYRVDWIHKNGISFESLNPDTGQTDIQIQQTMIADLNRLLGLNVHFEKRKEKVWVIRSIAKNSKINTKNSQTDDILIDDLAQDMSEQQNNQYVINESGNDKIRLPKAMGFWTDFEKINAGLKVYGLVLKEEERELDELIFTEVTNEKFNNKFSSK